MDDLKTFIRHVGLVVEDLEKSKNFWINCIGFKVMNEALESGPFVDNMMALDNVEVKTCKLKDENNNVLELLEFISHINETKIKDENLKVYRQGFTHIALQTSNIEQLILKIEKFGYSALNNPMTSPNGAAKVVYSIGPEKILLELVEII